MVTFSEIKDIACHIGASAMSEDKAGKFLPEDQDELETLKGSVSELQTYVPTGQ